MVELTPYDTGSRLEPQLWVRGDTASPGGLPRRAVDADYGRVDFDADDGTTILTLYVERTPDGFRLQIDQHSDDYLQVVGAHEPPQLDGPAAELDPEYRAGQMLALDRALSEIGQAYGEHVHYYQGDPLTFSPGHFVFHEDAGRGWFAIEELYGKGTDWEDPDRVPIGWAWHERALVLLPDGTTEQHVVAAGTTIPSDIASLVERARTWAWGATHRATGALNVAPDRAAPGSQPHREEPSR